MSHSGSIPQLRETQVEGIINGQGNDSIFLLGCTSLFRGKQCKYCVRGPVRCARITVVHFFVVPFGYLGVCSMTHIWLPIYEPYMTHIYIYIYDQHDDLPFWKRNQGLVVEARLPRRLWRPLPLVPPVPGRGKDFEGREGLGGTGNQLQCPNGNRDLKGNSLGI